MLLYTSGHSTEVHLGESLHMKYHNEHAKHKQVTEMVLCMHVYIYKIKIKPYILFKIKY